MSPAVFIGVLRLLALALVVAGVALNWGLAWALIASGAGAGMLAAILTWDARRGPQK